MAPRLLIEDGVFKDALGREILIRGINVAGDSKYPSSPNIPSHVADSFFDGDNINFHQRPFPKEDAHLHFSRIKKMGYNAIRYVFTWEAIEPSGPGQYDEGFIQHTIDTLRIAKEYGFYVFMDPHQDVWSRFCGGSGAPMWTLYAAGLNPQSFSSTEAAIVHNTYGDNDNFPKMIWSTNYYRLAAATMFTLFFAGRDFAPKCILDGKNIQDYLQDHFIGAMAHLAKRLHEAGDLLDDVVFGWETLNEPNKGLIGAQDISEVPKEQALRKGTCPSLWQAMLTGKGRAAEVDVWEMGGLGPYKSGRALVDPHGESAWLPADYDDSRYGWTRDPGWLLGECVWAEHGVWDPATDTLLRKDYFARSPRTGEAIDYPCFSDTYLMAFVRRYRDAVRAVQPAAVLLLQGATMELPPLIRGTPDGDDPRLVYSPHFYDGITLMTKKWNRTWNVDVVGVLRGRYLHPALAIRVGETAIRNCFRDQLAGIRREGLERMGKHPCVLTEFGIPYDMDDKHAYKTGDYSSQSAAMDANHYALEGALMEGYALWLYMANNDHERGDQWNGEDLSVVSLDDNLLPVSHMPQTGLAATAARRTQEASDSSAETAATTGTTGSSGTAGTTGTTGTAGTAETETGTNESTSTAAKDVDQDDEVNPTNLKRILTQPSLSSRPNSGGSGGAGKAASLASPELTGGPGGYRAAEAYVRPAPIAAAGAVLQYGFDLRRCTFTLTVQGAVDEKKVVAAKEAGLWTAEALAAPPDGDGDEDGGGGGGDGGADLLPVPTVVGLPAYHFPAEDALAVEVTGGGKWEIAWDTSETVLVQRLRWWHGRGEQTLRVQGRVRKHNVVEGQEEDGYYDQLGSWMGSCAVM